MFVHEYVSRAKIALKFTLSLTFFVYFLEIFLHKIVLLHVRGCCIGEVIKLLLTHINAG